MINKTILLGNLGKNPEIRTLESGVKVANFSLATEETFKDNSGQRKKLTTWHNIVLWRGLAEVAEKYLQKGDTVYIEGKITNREWTDKDGNKRYITEIVGSEMKMIGGKKEGVVQTSETPETAPIGEGMEPDGLPF